MLEIGTQFTTLGRQGRAVGPVRFDFSSFQLPGGVSFSRASEGTYFSPGGTLGTALADAPRFDANPVTGSGAGILVEPASTNLVAQSHASQASWTADSTTPTDLSLSALGVFGGVDVPSNGNLWSRLKISADVIAGQPYAVTVFYRAGTSANARIAFSGLPGGETHFSGTLGALSTTRSDVGLITNAVQELLQDGLTYRARMVFSPTATGTVDVGVGPQSLVLGETVICLGLQVEQATQATSFIQTSGAPLARAPDILTFDALSGVYDLTLHYADGSTQVQAGVAVSPGHALTPANVPL